MSQDNQASSSSNAPSTWTEPPWSGWIETTGDALLILEAARRGLIPRVTRRLVDSERKMITSGSVFVFDEDESGIKRWTDGFFWSPSRILGNFLLYRETEKRGAGHRSARQDREEYGEGTKAEAGQSLSRPKSETNRLGIDRQRERTLVGSLTNSYKFKQGGMMKKVSSCASYLPNSCPGKIVKMSSSEDISFCVRWGWPGWSCSKTGCGVPMVTKHRALDNVWALELLTPPFDLCENHDVMLWMGRPLRSPLPPLCSRCGRFCLFIPSTGAERRGY